jgi:hypothetical protein
VLPAISILFWKVVEQSSLYEVIYKLSAVILAAILALLFTYGICVLLGVTDGSLIGYTETEISSEKKDK